MTFPNTKNPKNKLNKPNYNPQKKKTTSSKQQKILLFSILHFYTKEIPIKETICFHFSPKKNVSPNQF